MTTTRVTTTCCKAGAAPPRPQRQRETTNTELQSPPLKTALKCLQVNFLVPLQYITRTHKKPQNTPHKGGCFFDYFLLLIQVKLKKKSENKLHLYSCVEIGLVWYLGGWRRALQTETLQQKRTCAPARRVVSLPPPCSLSVSPPLPLSDI